jgi:predicted nucleic acid-binding protein
MIYIETSSFLDYYLDRPRAGQVKEILIKHEKPMVLNPLIELEVNSVLGRLVNQKALTQHERIEFDQELYYDLSESVIIHKPIALEEVISKAIEITKAKGYTSRTMDTAHIAYAMLLEVDLFVCADIEQASLAKKVGLKHLLMKDQ